MPTIRKNLSFGLCAQTTSLVSNIAMSFIVSKALGFKAYAYWQLFIFYAGYVCFFHLGLPDGIYLKEGGKNINELNSEEIAGQLQIMIIFHLFLGAFIIIFSFLFVKDNNRKTVLVFIAYYLVMVNINNYLGMVCQSVNLAITYSKSVLIDRIFFVFFLLILISMRAKKFEYYIGLYCMSRTIATIYSIKKNKRFLCTRCNYDKVLILRLKENIKIGSNLMLSVIASSLVLGSGRLLIDKRWGIEEFGIFSFALTLSNFLLQFINQISIVLFPALRTMKSSQLGEMYTKLEKGLSLILELLPIVVWPMIVFINMWLPQYAASLEYFIFLLPICIYDGKTQMIFVTYLKVLRKEKELLKFNIITLLYSFFMSFIGAYVFNNIYIVIFSMVSSVVFRSIVMEVYISKLVAVKLDSINFIKIVSLLVFAFLCNYNKVAIATLLYLSLYIYTHKRDKKEFIK